jgi:hypothetical protein
LGMGICNGHCWLLPPSGDTHILFTNAIGIID